MPACRPLGAPPSEADALDDALRDWRYVVDHRYSRIMDDYGAYTRLVYRHRRHLFGLRGYMSPGLRDMRHRFRRAVLIGEYQ